MLAPATLTPEEQQAIDRLRSLASALRSHFQHVKCRGTDLQLALRAFDRLQAAQQPPADPPQ